MMLQRNLLYTAMTRARQLLVLIGSRKAVAMAVKNSRVEPRFTLLTDYLREIAARK
jgi:exodeoxyribonuclease V alpha subunit